MVLFLASCSFEEGFNQADVKSGSLARFIIKDGYMYSLNQYEVLTFELQPDGAPILRSELVLDYGLETIIEYGNLLYIGSRIGLYILDISNPQEPVLLSKTERSDNLIGGCDPVVVQDSFAYSTVKIINEACGLRNTRSALLVYNVEDPTAPEEVGQYDLNEPNGLGYKGNTLFICDEGDDRVILVDISDPRALLFRDIELEIKDPIDLIIHGDRMVVSTRTAFQFYDILDIHDIRHLGNIAK